MLIIIPHTSDMLIIIHYMYHIIQIYSGITRVSLQAVSQSFS